MSTPLAEMLADMSTPLSVAAEVLVELSKASAKFLPFNSGHEGFAVLLEEVDELKEEVFWGPTKFTGAVLAQGEDNLEGYNAIKRKAKIALMRAEAIQVAAMAMRFVIDVCDREETHA